MIFIIILIGLVILFFFISKFLGKAKINHVLLYFGETGSGKTLTGVKNGLKRLKKNQKKVKKFNSNLKLKNFIRKLFKKEPLNPKQVPQIYANFPIRSQYYVPITKEMLLLQEPIIENSVVILDEFGSMASQYQYDDEELRVNLAELTGKFRHYIGDDGLLILLDQSSERILKEVKYSLGEIYELQNFKKFIFFYIQTFIKYQNFKQIDMILTKENIKHRIGLIPIKKLYDSRYLKKRYGYLVQHQIKYPKNEVLVDLTTDDLIRLGEEKSNLDMIIKKAKKESKK